jgi:hypothetical protein
VLVGAALLGALLLAPIALYPFGRDQGAFAAVADVIGRGGVPYRDAWEIKPPGVYYLFWAVFEVFGRSMFAVRLFDVVWTLAAAALLFAIGRRLWSFWSGVLGALLFLARYSLGFDFWHTTQADGFASLPLAGAFALTLVAEERRRAWLALICGALVGLAMALKPTLGLFLLLPCLAALTAPDEPLRGRLIRGLGYAIGCFALLGGVALFMSTQGGLRDMIAIVLKWNSHYAALSSPTPLPIKIGVQTARFLFSGYWMLKLIGVFALVAALHLARERARGRFDWFVPTWALLMLAGVWVQDKYHAYHWLPVLPPLGLLAGHGVVVAGRWLVRSAGGAARPLAAAGVALLGVALATAWLTQFSLPLRYVTGHVSREACLSEFRDRTSADFSFAADLQVASYLAQRTEPGDSLYIWGFEPLVYFLADRPPASRFITVQPLVTPWSPPEWRSELIEDLVRARPPFILVLHNDVFPWVTAGPLDSAGQLEYYPELRALLAESYALRARIEDFDIYAYR